MTEREVAFCKRRIREELKLANETEGPQLQKVHWRRAKFYQDRLLGIPKAELTLPRLIVVK